MEYINQEELLDPNMYKKIRQCFINEAKRFTNKIFVIYEDGSRENIWTFDTRKIEFNPRHFIGMDKLEALYYCDQTTVNTKPDQYW